MTASTSTGRRLGGAITVLVGSALMIASVWMPWLDTPNEDPTGWEVSAALSDAGRNPWYEGSFFDSGFSPFLGGLSVLVVGGVLALIGLGMMLSLRAAAALPRGVIAVLSMLGVMILIISVANLFSLFNTGPGTGFVDPGSGLYLLATAGFAGYIGMLVGLGKSFLRRPSQASEVKREPSLPTESVGVDGVS